ncbi:unnamed protein product, partial [Brachionus calyciflorus]
LLFVNIKGLVWLEMDRVDEFVSLADDYAQISNRIRGLAPTLGNVVQVVEANQNIIHIIQNFQNQMDRGFQRLETRLGRRINNVAARLTNSLTRVRLTVDKAEKLDLIRSINSSCVRDNHPITWLKFRGRAFPHQANNKRQFNRLNNEQILNILNYYGLPVSAHAERNRKRIINYIGVPN